MTTSVTIADRFWSFSLYTYGRPGVAPACLALQDDVGLDVNVLLFCCFTAIEGAAPLDLATLTAADAAIEPWRLAAVQPLRAVRRSMKTDIQGVDAAWRDAVRTQVQSVELECERVIQSILATYVPSVGLAAEPPESLPNAVTNLAVYMSLAQVRPTAALRNKLATLLAAAIPGTDEAAADRALKDRL